MLHREINIKSILSIISISWIIQICLIIINKDDSVYCDTAFYTSPTAKRSKILNGTSFIFQITDISYSRAIEGYIEAVSRKNIEASSSSHVQNRRAN